MAAAAQHAVFGIDAADPAGSLLTCVKELFDNALDACAVHATGRIDVSVEPLDADGSLFHVKVTDDGCGFESEVLSARATELFSSSKGSSKELGGASAGAFGVGLKAVMQWAQASSQGSIEIKTTTRAAADLSVLRVKFDGGGTHEAVSSSRAGGSSFAMLHPSLEQTSEPKPRNTFFSGTTMSITLGGGPAAIERLATYFTCCSAYLSPTALTISVRLPDASRMQLRDGRCEWWTHTLHVPAISLDGIYVAEALSGASPPVLLGVRELLETWLGQHEGGRTGGTDDDDRRRCRRGLGDGVHVLNASSTVHATVLLSAVGTAEAPDVPPGSAMSSAAPELLFPTLSTVVFLNNKLLGEPGEALSAKCASIAGLRKAQWKRECGLALQSAGDSIQLSGEKGCPMRGLRIALHLRSAQHCPLVRFGDLAKTYVMPSKPLVSAIGKAIEGALRRAHQALAAQGCPVAKSDWQAREDRQSAAAIASSVGGIVSRSRDGRLLRACCEALQLGDEAEGTLDGDARTAGLAADVTVALLKFLECDWSEVLDSQRRGSDGNGQPDENCGGGEAVSGSRDRGDRSPRAIPPPARAGAPSRAKKRTVREELAQGSCSRTASADAPARVGSEDMALDEPLEEWLWDEDDGLDVW